MGKALVSLKKPISLFMVYENTPSVRSRTIAKIICLIMASFLVSALKKGLQVTG
jgi:hypothetical protein